MASAAMFPGTGPFAGPSVLDGPPPSPTPMGDGMGGGGPFSMKGLAGQGASPIPSGGMPPEVLTGATSALQTVWQTLGAVAQLAPNKGPQIALIQDMLQQLQAELMSDGAGPISPTASGPAFPGGGIDRGIAGPGSV